MSGTAVDHLPDIKAAASPILKKERAPSKQADNISVCFSPDVVSMQSSDRFPSTLMLKKGCRQKGYQNRTAAYGTPEVVKQIFTGQIPTTYFNDLCNGRRLSSRGEFYFRTPTKEREKPLWEPKHVEREKARHVIRDIQDARFRKEDAMRRKSLEIDKALRLKTEKCLLSESAAMPCGKQAFLVSLEKDRQKIIQKCKQSKKAKPARKAEERDSGRY